jgi:HEAT repeat protein
VKQVEPKRVTLPGISSRGYPGKRFWSFVSVEVVGVTSGLEVAATKIATSLTAAAGRSAAQRLRRGREHKDVTRAVTRALVSAFDAARHEDLSADTEWMAAAAAPLVDSFTPEVARALLIALSDASSEGERAFVNVAHAAVGVERAELLESTVSVNEFLHQFPRYLFAQLRDLAINPDGHVRQLVGHLLQQREDSRSDVSRRATPREFRDDIASFLTVLDEHARTGSLAPYLPAGFDAVTEARSVRVRYGVRAKAWGEKPDEWSADPDDNSSSRAYRLAAERNEDFEPDCRWRDVVAENPRLVVLADPGLGKSWLIRGETHRLCQEALAALAGDEDLPLIPIPLRCDQLVAAAGNTLADTAADYLVAQGILSQRSRAGVQALISAGEVMVLLDALDELGTPEERGRLKALLRSWTEHAGAAARCVVTSRIAGYAGAPVVGATEVELQAFTPEDVTAAIAMWDLSPPAKSRLLNRIKDPAIAGMARVPLLLALMCALAAAMSDEDDLPITRGELYERVLRWFLTRAHRAEENPKRPELLETEIDALLDILAPIAFHFATKPAGWTDLMASGELLTAIRGTGSVFSERSQSAVEILQDLSVGAGVLVPEGNPSEGRNPRYLFLHRTIAEYLVARHLVSYPEEHWLRIVDQHMWFDPDWAEVIRLLGAQLDPRRARRLVQHLLAQEVDPLHHALLAAVRVLAERADQDQLLAPDQMRAMADAISGLMDHPTARWTAAAQLATAPRLPRRVLDRLRDRLDDPDPLVRQTTVQALTGHEDVALVACLQDEAPRVRLAAMKALGPYQGRDVVTALLSLVNDGHWEVSKAAVEALGGRDEPEARDGLLACLHSDDKFMRQTAVEALACWDSPQVVSALLDRFNDREYSVRDAVCEALAGHSDQALLDGLLARLDGGDPLEREAAAKVIASCDEPQVLDALLDRLSGDDPVVRRAATGALAGWEGPDVVAGLLARLSDPAGEVRRAAEHSLSGRDAPGLLDELLERLHSGDPLEREAATHVLAAWEGPEVIARLLTCLDQHKDHKGVACRAAVEALAHWAAPGQETWPITDPHAVDANWTAVKAVADHAGNTVLADLLRAFDPEDPDPWVRCAAIRALGGQEGAEVSEQLLAQIHDEHHAVRSAAARMLAKRHLPGIVEGLVTHLSDPDWEVRWLVVEALAGHNGPMALQGVQRCLDDEEPLIRWAAVEALGMQTGPSVREALLECLSSQDGQYVRSPAVRALAKWGGQDITQVLLHCLDDDDHFVRFSALRVLAERDGQGVLVGLLSRLNDQSPTVREQAIFALWRRDGPGVLEGLLDRLDDKSLRVQVVALTALGDRERPEDLRDLARIARTARPETLVRLYQTAERLATRSYSYLASHWQLDVRADLAWLTGAIT